MAAKDLFKLRSKLVEKLSFPVLLQLLDSLLEAKVLNDGEVENIHSIKQRAEETRLLVDSVRMKGDRASELFIEALRMRDPCLARELGLHGQNEERSTPEVASIPPEPKPSNTLTLCTERFKQKLMEEKGDQIYPHSAKATRKRLALLINNIDFTRKSLQRRGADKDQVNMEKLLKNLGYDVEMHQDLTAEAIDQRVKDFSQREEHTHSDSTFVVLMSHGERDFIYGINYDTIGEGSEDLFHIDNVFKHLNTKNCAGLRDKPKVILVQACRGDETGSTWTSDSVKVTLDRLEDDSIKEQHKEKDFISLMSCTPDTKSYRHIEKGTLFVQHLVDVFNNYAHEDDIEELFRKVMCRFEGFPKQMPSKERGTLLKKFYLFPGL